VVCARFLGHVVRSRRFETIQQGQVFKLRSRGPDGQPLRAYRYRLEGRDSERPQAGGFAARAEAEKALRKALDRLGPGGGRATITLAEFVDEYLEMHQAAQVTIAKLRWLLSKATAVLDRAQAIRAVGALAARRRPKSSDGLEPSTPSLP
jgi:hypothetical protein